jgi:5-methylcytosine-specific restriction endonuclease McrA
MSAHSPYIRFLIVRPEEVLDFLPEDGWPYRQMYFGKIVYMNSTRYQVFKRNRRCVFCGVEGVYMALEADKNAKPKSRRHHFNLYTNKGRLMTQDHKIPLSLGGTDDLSNLQCACTNCNKHKGNRTEEVLRTDKYFQSLVKVNFILCNQHEAYQ